jgi:hypothetical protein
MISTAKIKIDELLTRLVCRAIFYVGVLSLLLTPAYAGPPKCTRDEAMKAETEASSLKSWKDLFSSYERYCQCDDGAIAEGYSNSVATLLANHWDQFGELAALTKKHPHFKEFVLRHIDETMTSEQARSIQEHVRAQCQSSARLCTAIAARLTVVGKEARQN